MITAEDANRNVLTKRANEICETIGDSIDRLSQDGEKNLKIVVSDFVSSFEKSPRMFVLQCVKTMFVGAGYVVSLDSIIGEWEIGW